MEKTMLLYNVLLGFYYSLLNAIFIITDIMTAADVTAFIPA